MSRAARHNLLEPKFFKAFKMYQGQGIRTQTFEIFTGVAFCPAIAPVKIILDHFLP